MTIRKKTGKEVKGEETPTPCPVESALNVMGGRWKTLIIWQLRDETLRFTQLIGNMPIVTPRMLTKQLRELEEDGLITRKYYPEVPPRVEYSLTDLGRAAMPVLDELYTWGALYLKGKGYTLPKKDCDAGTKKTGSGKRS